LFKPSVHVRVIYPAQVLISSLARLIGASGASESFKIAPFPSVEGCEAPITLYAIILAKTLVPGPN
jgi:hypothetical protein